MPFVCILILQEVEIFKKCREEMRQLLADASNQASYVQKYELSIILPAVKTLRMQDMKLTDMKMSDQLAGHENAGSNCAP